MKNFAKRTKRFLIITLVLVFALALAAPASAGVGADIRTPLSGSPIEQNLYFGAAIGGSGGNLMLLQDGLGSNRFKIDRSGNVEAVGKVSSTQICISGACQSSWPSATNYWSVLSGNIYNNTGTNVGIGTTGPESSLHIEKSVSGGMGAIW